MLCQTKEKIKGNNNTSIWFWYTRVGFSPLWSWKISLMYFFLICRIFIYYECFLFEILYILLKSTFSVLLFLLSFMHACSVVFVYLNTSCWTTHSLALSAISFSLKKTKKLHLSFIFFFSCLFSVVLTSLFWCHQWFSKGVLLWVIDLL